MTATASSKDQGVDPEMEKTLADQRKNTLAQQETYDKIQSSSDTEDTIFPSPFVADLAGTEDDYLGSVVKLAARLRKSLTGGELTDPKEDESRFLSDPEVCRMLLGATPHPERAAAYSQIFAKRSLELYKATDGTNNTMQAGPLQSTLDHPKYIDILMKCIREPFIANMGTFDETEFFLWLIIDVDFHTTESEKFTGEPIELDDSYYEFSAEFFERFPFCGTKQLIANANKWRKGRGEDLILQTAEMAKAEVYIQSLQDQALIHDEGDVSKNDGKRKSNGM
ncbi:hypothetical protein CBS101457_004887 [Exobasidium rhododendri]|nr:hypothetical protein CBS101457_004887 [Exobasidium rhododendri]